MKKTTLSVYTDISKTPFVKTELQGYVSKCNKFFVALQEGEYPQKRYSIYDMDTKALLSGWLPTIKRAIEKGEQMYKDISIDQWNEARNRFNQRLTQ